MQEVNDLRNKGLATVERLKAGKCPAPWRKHLDAGDEAFFYLPYFSALCLGVKISEDGDEEPPPTELEWLRLAHELPMVFDALRRQIDATLSVAAAAIQAEYVEKKSETSEDPSPSATG